MTIHLRPLKSFLTPLTDFLTWDDLREEWKSCYSSLLRVSSRFSLLFIECISLLTEYWLNICLTPIGRNPSIPQADEINSRLFSPPYVTLSPPTFVVRPDEVRLLPRPSLRASQFFLLYRYWDASCTSLQSSRRHLCESLLSLPSSCVQLSSPDISSHTLFPFPLILLLTLSPAYFSLLLPQLTPEICS